MNDFLTWLYPRYIKPYLDGKLPGSPCETILSLLEGELIPDDRRRLEQAVAFFATESFLLGVRTGQGLAAAL